MLIGLSLVSCKQKPAVVDVPKNEPKKDTIEEPTCYKLAIPADTPNIEIKTKSITAPEIINITTSCYDVAVPVEPLPPIISEPSCYVPIAPEYIEEQDSNFIYTIAEQMPQFPGGEKEMTKFLTEHLHYPKELRDIDITGNVYLKFVVTKKGDIEQIQVLRSTHQQLSNEAIRVVKLMPKWISAKQNGKNVACYFTIPIKFELQ